jgi:hypothetical protein
MSYPAALDRQRVCVLPGDRLSRRDAATYLGRKPKTLAIWASTGRGPPIVYIAGRCFYEIAALDAFIASGNEADAA